MRTSVSITVCALVGVSTLVGSSAHGEESFARRFALRGEGGADVMVSEPQSREFGPGVHGIGRLSVDVVGPLSVQLSAGAWWFMQSEQTMDQPMGRNTAFSGGLRVSPRLSSGFVGGPTIDANAGVALTGDVSRFMFDVGLGWEFVLGNVALGPVVRYGHVVQPDDQPRPEDAQFVSAGLAVAVRLPEERPAPAQPPVVDTDRDGVIDWEDRCVQIPEDRDQFEDHDGCPEIDNDRDGLADARDRCPSQAETRNQYQDDDGCPDEGPSGAPRAVIEESRIVINQTIQFEYDQDVILPVSEPILMEVVGVLRAHPEIRRIRVEGHADERGSSAHNQDLSARRAAAVARFLRQHGVRQTIESAGYGSSRPLCREDTEECHARNRRVEFVIVDQSGGSRVR